MKEQRDFTRNEYRGVENNRKFNWWVPILGLFIILGVMVFAPVTTTKTYSNTTQIYLKDAVAVEFDWTADYDRPVLIIPRNALTYEERIEFAIKAMLNETIKPQFTSGDLYFAEDSAIMTALDNAPDLGSDQQMEFTVKITNMRFESEFMDKVNEYYRMKEQAALKKIEMEKALAEADSARAYHEKIVAEEQAKYEAMSPEEQAEYRVRSKEQIAVANAKIAAQKVKDEYQNQ